MHADKNLLDSITNYKHQYRHPGKGKPQWCRSSSFPEASSTSKCKWTFIRLVLSVSRQAKVFKFHQLANTRHTVISTLVGLVFNPPFSDDIVSDLKFKPKLL